MYPHERSLVKQYRDQPFSIVGVNSDKDRAATLQVKRDKNLPWRSFWNGPLGTGGAISSTWNIQGWPTVFLIDHEGVIRRRDVRGDELDAAIAELVKRAEGR